MKKAELRRLYLDKRRGLAAGEVAGVSSEISERFFNEVDLAAVKTLHTFIRIAKFNEFDTSMIYYRIWHERRGIATCAPLTDRETGELAKFDTKACEKFRGHPFFEHTLRFCDLYDQSCFDPKAERLPIETFEPMVRRVFGRVMAERMAGYP